MWSVYNLDNNTTDKIYIFGAHSRGRTFGVYVNELWKEKKILGYLVDNDEDNPLEIDGVPVIRLGSVPSYNYDLSATVYVATRGQFFSSIKKHLESAGFSDIVQVNPELDMKLRNEYVKAEFCKAGKSFIKLDDLGVETVDSHTKKSFFIYVVKSEADSELKEKWISNSYQGLIQAGAVIASNRLNECYYYDDAGDNISERNKQFCELTALYWIWKNAKEDYIGLEHYRRHFLLNDKDVGLICSGKADVVLPVPLFVSPSLKDNFLLRHDPKPWNAMKGSLEARYPEDYKNAMKFFESNGFYSPCNMFIAKREALDDLCSWMFPIIFDVTEKVKEIDDKYQNRYPGFLSERLMSFFFESRKNKYKVVYADKNFIA